MINEVKICKQNQIVNLKNDKCIRNLLENKAYECIATNTDHIQNIEEISNGLILLNNFKGNITTNKTKTRNLIGSFLIKFFNETIIINNMNFTTLETHSLRPLPPLIQHSNSRSDFEEVLSLKFMKDLNIKNIKKLVH